MVCECEKLHLIRYMLPVIGIIAPFLYAVVDSAWISFMIFYFIVFWLFYDLASWVSVDLYQLWCLYFSFCGISACHIGRQMTLCQACKLFTIDAIIAQTTCRCVYLSCEVTCAPVLCLLVM